MNHLVFTDDNVVNEGPPLGRLKKLDRLIDRPNVFPICPSADFGSPQCSAIFAPNQCVAFASVDFSVSTASYSTRSTLISTGRPVRAYQPAHLDACPGTGWAMCASSAPTPSHATTSARWRHSANKPLPKRLGLTSEQHILSYNPPFGSVATSRRLRRNWIRKSSSDLRIQWEVLV